MAFNTIDGELTEPAFGRSEAILRLALAAFGLMGARLAGAVFGFLSQLLLARSFPSADVGVVFLAMSVTIFISLLMTYGYHTLALTYLARYRAFGRPGLVDAFLAVSRRDMVTAALAILVGSVLIYFLVPLPEHMAKALLFGCLAAVPLAALRLNNSAANAQRRFTLSYAPDFVARPGLLLLFVAGMVFLGVARDVDYVLVALVAISFIAAIGQALILGSDNVWTWRAPMVPRDLTRFLRHRAVAMLLVTLVGGASADLVVMLGGLFMPPAQVAVLGVAVRLAALIGFFSSASQPFVLRDLASAMSKARGQEIDRLLLRMNVAGLSIMGAAFVGCAIFGPMILRLYGADYGQGYWPLLLFIVGQAFRTSGGMNGELLALGGHQVKSASLCFCAVLVLVVLAALLTPRWGIMGLAASSIVAEAFWAGGLAFLTQRLEGRRGDIVGLLLRRWRAE
jgi:O-antigen/teichoic acid export membrane protein